MQACVRARSVGMMERKWRVCDKEMGRKMRGTWLKIRSVCELICLRDKEFCEKVVL